MAAVPRTYTYDVRTMKSLSVTRVRRSTAVRAVAYPPVSSSIPFDSESRHLNDWEPGSWRNREALQQPEYPNEDDLVNTVKEIEGLPPLVFAGECRLLQSRVAAAANGEAFLLFGGDCAEAFSQFSADRIRDFYRVLLQMSVVMMFGGGIPVVKIGRIAGQFAKPRSADLEEIDGVSLPSYRGDIINGPEFTEEARIPNPDRLVQAYNQSAATMNLLRAFSTGGYAGLDRATKWNLDFMENTPEGEKYQDVARRVDESIQFMKALTRLDSTSDLWYDCSAHFVWCGERTRQLDKAHVEFLRGVANPIGVKVSNKSSPEGLAELCRTLNPDNTPGRLGIIIRMGAANVRDHLPGLIKAVEDNGLVVTWICDPVHGNTETVNGYKTRRYDNIRGEVEAFFDVHEEMGTFPGGVHLEMTGDNVTECIGGGSSVEETDLSSRYHTHCDPRLNAEQALEMAFYVAERLNKLRNS